MNQIRQNYYGSLCTELYEILHDKAPEDELEFYLSYAHSGDKILEALCGSGRFLVPFVNRGFDITGIDLSMEMLSKLKQKAPNAKIIQADILEYSTPEKYDYIFISSGSVSLFTDIDVCVQILEKLKTMLTPKGKFVFAVDTVTNKLENDENYKETVAVKTKDGFDLVLKSKNYYEKESQTQFSPGVYELYNTKNELLQKEFMDFQTHLYRMGEMEQYLKEIGFTNVKVYSSFSKEIALGDDCEMLLFECSALNQ